MSIDPQQQEFDLPKPPSIIHVEKYEFEPIQGYPMLRWKGKRPFISTQYYPAQHKETYGYEIDGWRNKIYWGDNLQVMSHLLREFRGKMKLIYIDPPFDSKADYKRTITIRGKSVLNDRSTFEEKQYTDIWTNDEYLQFMYERLILIKELLASDGSIYVQLDWHIGHYVKVLLDEIFGSDNFKNEIIWKRSLPHNDPKKYGVIHDTILFYTKKSTYVFNQQFTEQSEEYKKSHYTLRDLDGRVYRLQSLSASGPGPARKFGNRMIVPPAGTHWRFSQEKIDELLAKGLIIFTSTGQPNYKRYLDESKGSALQSIWIDVNPLNPQALERLDYPTQKPEALLERIIESSSNEDDLIFDCFMGSGTTQAVAMKLGRRFIGADINLGAVQITTKRLLTVASELTSQPPKLILEEDLPANFYTGIDVYNVNNYDIFRNPAQAKEILIQALEVNPLPSGSLFDGEKNGRMIKVMPINRIATRQDLNELITGFDYRAFEKRQTEHPNQVVEKVTIVCMGHEPDLAAHLKLQIAPFKIDVEIMDILRDKQNIQFKRDSESRIVIDNGYLTIEQFYPMNLLAKLSLQQENIEDWRELVDSVMVDWNYDGAILQPAVIDVPEGNKLVIGRYKVPDDAGTIRIKITDLLSESLEKDIIHG